MELIEHYQPEYVIRFAERVRPCDCPACQNRADDWPATQLKLKNQQRDSLDAGCETAAREILLNPQAFVLHTSTTRPDSDLGLSAWDETLNQQCINLAVHPALTLESSLYATGVLLSKAQRYLDNDQCDPQLLLEMGEQLADLAERGILDEQLQLLPPIEVNRVEALEQMGAMRLTLNLPAMQKMSMMLKLSELAVMQPARLQDRLLELETVTARNTLLTDQPHILRNALIYKLYGECLPGPNADNYGDVLMSLTRMMFQLKMLCAMWLEDNAQLTHDDVVALFSAWFSWQSGNVWKGANSADYTLLCGLSLI
ncbi:MAG TPA: hypothetical protein VGN40_08500 [Lelliottia sp.]|jgi:lysine-N-methylase